ncbi:MAG: hypothetical protein RLZZ175_1772 [Bacteroidota bacterium]|jgi:type III pantothenate kinase
MNLAIDAGNTATKYALFEGENLVEFKIAKNQSEVLSLIEDKSIENVIIGSVGHNGVHYHNLIDDKSKVLFLDGQTPIPFKNQYSNPSKLGVDRIAGVAAAIDLFAEMPILIIDIGTCITFDFVDKDKNYWGGAISPGVNLRFKSMHNFTASLPLIEQVNWPQDFIGSDTQACLTNGVLLGIQAEINYQISLYIAKYPELRVVLCGGSISLFETKINAPIFVCPNLLLMGLNSILRYNVKK